MKRVILCVVVAVGVLVTASWAQQPKLPSEYKFVYQCDEKKANNIAAEGWELADMSMTSYGSIGVATCVFKRAK